MGCDCISVAITPHPDPLAQGKREPELARGVVVALVLIMSGVASAARAGVIVYSSDFSGGKVQKIDGATKTTLTSGLSQPMGLGFGPDGKLYVAQQSGKKIGRYTAAGAASGATFGTGRYYTGLTFAPDGMLYTCAAESSFLAGVIERFDPVTGAAAGNGRSAADVAGYASGITGSYFEGLTFGPDGNLYASSHYASAVLVYQGPAGASPGALVTTLTGVDKPVGLGFGPDGKLYVVEQDHNRVMRWEGSAFSIFASGSMVTPIGMGFGSDGDLYVANYTGANLAHFQGPGGGTPGAFVGTYATGVGNPGYILVVPEASAIWVIGGAIAVFTGRPRRGS